MTRKLTNDEIKEWKNAVKEGFRQQATGISEKSSLKPNANRLMPKLDLHGMTLERAHKKFMEFVAIEFMEGSKKLLVITGKGTNNNGRIKKELPHWCEAQPLNEVILSCLPAETKHGGDGAFYIKLKTNL